MKKYEIMYIVNASLDDEQFQKVTDRLNNTIIENGGTIDQFDDWGIKEFAYEIDHIVRVIRARGACDTPGLVEGQDDVLLLASQDLPVQCDDIPLRDLVPEDRNAAVDRNPALFHQPVGRTAGGRSRFADELVEADAVCHDDPNPQSRDKAHARIPGS